MHAEVGRDVAALDDGARAVARIGEVLGQAAQVGLHLARVADGRVLGGQRTGQQGRHRGQGVGRHAARVGERATPLEQGVEPRGVAALGTVGDEVVGAEGVELDQDQDMEQGPGLAQAYGGCQCCY